MDTRQDRNRTGLPAQVLPAAFTVSEFCSAHRISRALFYILARDGRAPTIFKCGRRTLISVEAAKDWRQRLEATSEAAQ